MRQAIAGMMRIKNEARWIREAVESILPICTNVYILDDHSTDGTAELCEAIAPGRVIVTRSPFEGIDEKRDKDHLLKLLMKDSGPDWVLHIDGDEVLEAAGLQNVRACAESTYSRAYSLQVMYLWDTVDRVRVDGIYGDFWRPSLFKTAGSCLRFRSTKFGGNFHCSSVPADHLDEGHERCRARLKHYGYLDREQRIRKYGWYNSIDPNNLAEDCYRHMVAGDLPEVPADVRTKHAGPVAFEPWP